MASSNFSNLSKFNTPELSKRDGAKPFNSKLHRRESLGLMSPPFKDGTQFNFQETEPSSGQKNLEDITNNLPSQTNFRSEVNFSPSTKARKQEHEPIRIPIKILQNDGGEKILNHGGSLNIDDFKKRMQEQFDNFGSNFGKDFMDLNLPTMSNLSTSKRGTAAGKKQPPPTMPKSDVFKPKSKGPPPRSPKKSDEPVTKKPLQKNESIRVTAGPPRVIKREQPASPEQDKTLDSEEAPKIQVTRPKEDSYDQENDSGPGSHVDVNKSSPVLNRRRNKSYSNSRRNSMKITPEISEDFEKATEEVGKNEAQNGGDETKVENSAKTEEITKNELTPTDKLAASKFFTFYQDILLQAFNLSGIIPNFYAQNEAQLKDNLKIALIAGEYLTRILEKIDGQEIDRADVTERTCKKLVSSMAYDWCDKADNLRDQVQEVLKERETGKVLEEIEV